MNYKLLIIVFSWLATIGSLFLFSSDSKSEPQTASIVDSMTTPSPSKTFVLKIKPNPAPTQEHVSTPTDIFSPTPSFYLSPTTTPALISTPTSTPSSSTLAPTPTAAIPTSTLASSLSPVSEQSAKININTANSQELDKITGVGPVIAQRIIDYRDKNGPFQKIEDIKKVNGIGDIKFEKMKSEITI